MSATNVEKKRVFVKGYFFYNPTFFPKCLRRREAEKFMIKTKVIKTKAVP